MTAKRKKIISSLLRVTVCIVALLWVLHGVSLRDYIELADGQRVQLLEQDDVSVTILRDTTPEQLPLEQVAVNTDDGTLKIVYGLSTVLRNSNHSILLIGLLVFGPVPFIQSLRFVLMLRAQDIRISYWEGVKLSFAGNFLNFVAIGTTGGDVVKAYYISLHTDRKTEAVTTIFLDRVIGLTGLLTMAGMVIFICAGQRELQVVGYCALSLLLVVTIAACLLGSVRVRQWIRSRSLMSGWIRKIEALGGDDEGHLTRLQHIARVCWHHIQRADKTTHRLLRHKRLVLTSFLLTVLLQGIAVCSFVIPCWALGMKTGNGMIWDFYAVISTGLIVGAIPISPQGLGTVEAVYKVFLLGSHATLSQLLCMAMAVRLFQLIWSLPGAIVAMTGSYRPRQQENSPPSPPNSQPEASSRNAGYNFEINTDNKDESIPCDQRAVQSAAGV